MSPFVILAALAGVCFAVIGIGYRVGKSRGVEPMPLALVLAVIGSVFFGVKCCAGFFGEFPARALVCGALAGVCQYLALRSVQAGLARGPLSPVWCAVALGFVPVIVYSRLAFAEAVHPAQYAAIATAVGCVLVASIGQRGPAPPGARPRPGIAGHLVYLAILLAIFLGNGGSNIAMKDLGMHPAPGGDNYLRRHMDAFLLALYLVLAAGILADLLATGGLRSPPRWTVGLGCVAGGASVCGMQCAAVATAALPAAVVFTVSSTVSVLGAAVVSVLAFGEKPSLTWFGTVALAVLTVVLANLPNGWF